MFIEKGHLKPGMILERDIILNDGNKEDVLLVKGQVLNRHYINKILFYNVNGVHIVNKDFDDLSFELELDEKLEKRALTEIKDFYSELDDTGRISNESVIKYSEVVDELVTELLVKKELTNNVMIFRNHDEYTYQHCLSVANLSISTGIAMGLEHKILHDLGMAGFLHDIGKTIVPKEIINKADNLTAQEFEIMKTHSQAAVDMLKGLVSNEILEGILTHHEKYDGTGYPHGLKKNNIPLYGKILSVCDVYHALTSDRSYKKSYFPPEVMEYLMGNADTHFDYDILTIFLKNIIAFPVGTFVKLSNNKSGIVVHNHKENNLRPVVRLLNSNNSKGEEIDLFNNYTYMNVTIVAC